MNLHVMALFPIGKISNEYFKFHMVDDIFVKHNYSIFSFNGIMR